MNDLNPQQEKAVNFKDGVCAVIAVPGSGKTLTMMERIETLVEGYDIPPENILGLTFTKNAAEEMKKRLLQGIGDIAYRVHLSTIHSFCYFLLRNENEYFDILFGKDQIIFMKNLIKEAKCSNLSVGNALREISLAKNNLITVSEFQELHQGDETFSKIGEIYALYEKRKYTAMLKDFDDLLFDVYRMFSTQQDILKKYQEKYTHILIDEFQDTNPAQIEIIKLLVGNGDYKKGYSFWICGDDAQSIYSFTGASVGNILNFQNIYPESELIILNLNYRSSKNILWACSNLISHNLRQIHKELETNNPEGEKVLVMESSTEEQEALAVVNEIRDLLGNGYNYSDMAVLYRANFQSRILEETFLQHKIPYHITNGLNFYQRREIKILLDYLRLILAPDTDEGDEALVNIINVPNRYIGKKFIRELEQKARGTGCHLYELLKTMHISTPYIRKGVAEFIRTIDPLIQDSSLAPAELISLLRNTLDYDRAITEDDIPTPDDSRVQNIDQLQMAAGKFQSIKAFLDYTDTFEEALSVHDSENGVSLMTIHKSKGLEFQVVFLVGMVEGILPTKKGDLEEERRICFVAMSRAMQLLYLSYSQTYLGQPVKKSQFIDESFDQQNKKEI